MDSLILIYLASLCSVASSYRHLRFTNTDVCDTIGSTKEILLGDGALVLSLNANNDSFRRSQDHNDSLFCHVKVKTREEYGLMVFVEDLYLRSHTINGSFGDCLDYLEFGKDDFIPLVTLERSEKLCQNQSGFHFDEPKGNLLIWLKLGPYSPTAQHPESLRDTAVSLIITPYLKRRPNVPKSQMRRCAKGNWIQTRYFCDGRVNCALDPQGLWTDEAPQSCATTQAPKPKVRPTRPTVITTTPAEDLATGLDLSLGTIVLVSILSLSLIACIIVVTLKHCGLLGGPNSEPEDSGCPDQALGMLELSRTPARAQENTYVAHQGRPATRTSPLRHNRATNQPTASRTPAASSRATGISSGSSTIAPPKEPILSSPNPEEAPPPSYNEIFPPGTEPDVSNLQNEGRSNV